MGVDNLSSINMGDAENQPEQEREQGGRIDTRFLSKPSGYLGLVNMVLAFVSMCMMSAWLGDTRYRGGGYNFFMYACTHTWVACLVIFIIRLVKIPSYCTILNWDITFTLNAAIFVILLCIGSALTAIAASDYNIYYAIGEVKYSTCSKYSCILLIITAYAINCLLFVIFLLIASSTVIKKAVDFRDYCDHYDCNLLTATACFGFITMITCMVECFFHVQDWKTS